MDFGRNTKKDTFIPTSSMGDIAFLLNNTEEQH
jgi:hypothetical protein